MTQPLSRAVPDPDEPSAIVVGAGISGLTAAYRLARAGFRVRVLEADTQIGGRMGSVERGGFTMNRGALILPGAHEAVAKLALELGFAKLSPLHGALAILREGELHRVRSNRLAIDGVRTRLVSWKSKAMLSRLAFDALRMMPKLSSSDISGAASFDTQTAKAYGERHFNAEIQDYVIDPVVRGLCTDASIVEFFSASVNILGTGFLSYPGGINFLVEALAAQLEVHMGARVTGVEQVGSGAQVEWEQDGERHSEAVDACVLAMPAPQAAELYAEIDAEAAMLMRASLRYIPAIIAHFGLSRRPSEPALLVLVPSAEDRGLYTLAFEHNLRPTGVPAGKGQLTTNWAHEWCEAHWELDDDALIERMLPSVEALVPELRETLEITHIERWRSGVMRGSPGYCGALAQLAERLDPRCPVQLAGDYFTTSSTNAALLSGERAAKRIIEAHA